MNLKINDIIEKYEAVLFDMDGTLVDSMWVWNKIDKDFLTKYKFEVPETLKADIQGMSYYQTACYFKDTFKLEESIEEIISTWDQMALETYKNEVPIKSGAEGFIKTLRDNGIKTAICTSNSRFLTEAVLEKYPVLRLIDVVITSDEVREGKPSPDVYLTGASKLSVNPCKCLVFEDLPNGILAGKNAGMTTCTIDDGFSAKLIDQKVKLADFYIHDYEDLL